MISRFYSDCSVVNESTLLYANSCLHVIHEDAQSPTLIFCDWFLQKFRFHKRSKHININFHFMRELEDNKDIEISCL